MPRLRDVVHHRVRVLLRLSGGTMHTVREVLFPDEGATRIADPRQHDR